MSDSPPDNPSPTEAKRPRSAGGRRFAAVTMTFLTGLLIWYSSSAIYRDSFATAAPDPRDATCAAGIRRLHDDYASRLHDGAGLSNADADRSLLGLRGVCEREGEAGATAYRHFERWRYRAEGAARFERDTLDEDAHAALAYQSPGSHR